MRDTGWRRPIERLKLHIIFRKRAMNYRALLRKMTCKDQASYASSPPRTNTQHIYSCVCVCVYLCTYICMRGGGEEPQDALSSYVIRHFPQKSPMISGSFAKVTCSLRHPMGLRHPVPSIQIHACVCVCTCICMRGVCVFVHIHIYLEIAMCDTYTMEWLRQQALYNCRSLLQMSPSPIKEMIFCKRDLQS